MTNDDALHTFGQRLDDALQAGTCERLLLSGPVASEDDLLKVLGRPVALKGQPHLSLVWRYRTRDITKNIPAAQASSAVLPLCGMAGFRNAHLDMVGGQSLQLAFSRKGKATLRQGRHTPPAADGPPDEADRASTHNRHKQRWIDPQRPFLRELGVTDAQAQVLPTMSRKWKQINKFVEIFAAALAGSRLAQARDLHVVDFGSGKGYLTFAVHDWLTHMQGVQARVTGVELRSELVDFCQGVIDRLGLTGMQYAQGDVRHYHPEALHVVIALHACDVATDHAIFLGMRAGADIILCSPCCHKELRPQLLSPHPLRPILKHGIHLGQQAEMLTDGLRAMLLEAGGYDTQVFEFVSLEHTDKNKMILAVRRERPHNPQTIWQQVDDIKAFHGIQQQCLEQLMTSAGWRKP